MTTQSLQPIPNEPALFLNTQRILVVTDLHIGIEHELRIQGLHIPSQTQALTHYLVSLIEKIKPLEVILLGDIKHNIPTSTREERHDVYRFLETLISYSTVHIVPGNHDGNIHKWVPEPVQIHPSDGFICGGTGFVHGHRWPREELMTCTQLLIGHTHPTIQLTDRLGYKTYEPCWLRGEFQQKKLEKRYPRTPYPELIIMPAFHPLCGGVAANTEHLLGPLAGSLDIQKTHVYLIDGSHLGKVGDIH
ncbi:MAG: metallophosphoesterase [Methanobacteriota archaeon]